MNKPLTTSAAGWVQGTMPELPADAAAYSQTPQFDQQSIPAGLLREHRTKAGTWGRLNVSSGRLAYQITEPGCECEYVVTVDNPGVIVPEQAHHIRALGEVSFHVAFYRRPQSANH